MMNNVSFLEALWLTLQVLAKVAYNFAPVIILGLVFVTVLRAREVLHKSKKCSLDVQRLSKEDLRWQAHLAQEQAKQLHETQK